MNIAIDGKYMNLFDNDRMFKPGINKLSQNLNLPQIELKNLLEKEGHQYHTSDMYDKDDDIDVAIFYDMPYSILTIDSLREFISYFLHKRYKNDFLYKMVKKLPRERLIFVAEESPVIWPKSYKRKFHKYFGTVLTWDDNLVKKYGYTKYLIYQVNDGFTYNVPYEDKKLLTMVNSSYMTEFENGLYIERFNTIKYCEENNIDFDLYGFGWTKERPSYKGTTDNKHETMSKYKFAVCYENVKDLHNYITEKIFDCFHSNCVPIYWGADNVGDLIPSNTFIDRRKFSTNKEMIDYISNIGEEEYNKYITAINTYLNSDRFKETFDYRHFVDEVNEVILKAGN